MERDLALGRRMVFWILAVNYTVSLLLGLMEVAVLGMPELWQVFVRLMLMGALCISVIRRMNWARWAFIVLLGVGCIGGIYTASTDPHFSLGASVLSIESFILIGVTLIHLVSAFLFWAAWPIRVYCDTSEAKPD